MQKFLSILLSLCVILQPSLSVFGKALNIPVFTQPAAERQLDLEPKSNEVLDKRDVNI